MKTQVTFTLDRRLLNPYLMQVTDASASRAARAATIRARVRAPYRTGTLAKSIVARRTVNTPDLTSYMIGSNVDYAGFQEEGVLHRIYPRKAKALRFKPKGSNVFVFAKSTRGVPAVHYLRDAANTLTLADF